MKSNVTAEERVELQCCCAAIWSPVARWWHIVALCTPQLAHSQLSVPPLSSRVAVPGCGRHMK